MLASERRPDDGDTTTVKNAEAPSTSTSTANSLGFPTQVIFLRSCCEPTTVYWNRCHWLAAMWSEGIVYINCKYKAHGSMIRDACHVFYGNVCQLESFVRVCKWCFMCGEDTLLLISELHSWESESVHFKLCGLIVVNPQCVSIGHVWYYASD